MAIEIIEKGNLYKKYAATCPVCQAKIQYLGSDLRVHRNFPNGYVYCPGCNNPIAHNEANFIAEERADPEEARKQYSELLACKKELTNSKNAGIAFGSIVFLVGLALLIAGVVTMVMSGQIAFVAMAVSGFLFLMLSIPVIVVPSTTYERKVEIIDRQLFILENSLDQEPRE